MSASAVLVIALLVLAWAALSGVLGRHSVTGPLVFVLAGYLLANPDWGVVSLDLEAETIYAVAEITLALVLFSDASRIKPSQLRHGVALPARLLAIGLPLSIALGGILAARPRGSVVDGMPGSSRTMGRTSVCHVHGRRVSASRLSAESPLHLQRRCGQGLLSSPWDSRG